MDITLEDVEVAIKILYVFLKKQRQAQSLLSRLGVGRASSMYGLSFEQILNMVMAQKGVQKGDETLEEPIVTEEELKRMREIASKLKGESRG